MGITVVSSPASATASASANSAPPSSTGVPEGLPGGFAALLGSQLGRTIASNLGTATPPRDSEKTEEKPLGNENADQTLALLMAVPPVTPPVQPNQSVRLDTNITRNEAAKPQDATPLLGTVISEARGTNEEASGLTATDLAQQSSDAFKNALSTARDKQSETPTANIAAETAAQASAAIATAKASTENRSHATTAPAEIETHLQSPSWGQDFGNKVVWMAKNDQQSAQININPPQLGPVQITLQINGDQATAIFASPHTEVRQAIEGSLSQLRDMLATAGINLGQADVGANMARHNDNTHFQSANGNRAPDETAILPDIGRPTDGAPSALAQRGRGLVDLFA